MTPQQFGAYVGKQAFIMLPGMVGAGLGAVTAPTGGASGMKDMQIRAESVGRGAAKGVGTGLGAAAGTPLGFLAALLLTKGRARRILPRAIADRRIVNAVMRRGVPGAYAGAGVGGAAGYAGADALLGKPSWEAKTAATKQAEGYANQLMNNLTGANVNLPPQQKTMAGRMTDPNYSVLAAGGQHIAKQIQSPFKPVGGALGGLPAMANALNNSRIGLGRQLGENAYSAGKTLYNNPARALLGGLPSAAAPLVPGAK